MTSLSGLDAMALAVFAFESGHLSNATVPAIRNNNPGNLRLASGPSDEKGYSIFPDFQTGYRALLAELHSKFTGFNSHKIGQTSTLLDLFNIYAPPSDDNPTNEYAAFVAGWVGKALGRPIAVSSLLRDIWAAPAANTPPQPPPAPAS